MRAYPFILSFVLATLLPLPLVAAEQAAARKATSVAEDDPRKLEVQLLKHHPDLLYRYQGMRAYQQKDYPEALMLLRRAARFGDKPAQAMIGEMYAKGTGVAQDPVLAYIWMDLAAERGYKDFVLHRERYWERLDEAARERAVREGEVHYAEYGDEVAKPRFANQLRRASKQVVGSRTGFANNVQIEIPGPAGSQVVDEKALRSISFWDPEQYWAMQDRFWRDPAKARVHVGDAVRVADAVPAAPAAPEPRPDN